MRVTDPVKKLLLATAGLVTLVTPLVVAQSSPIVVADSPTFEVASVKPTKPGTPLPFVLSPSRFTMRAPVRVLIQNAYQLLQDGQLDGGPSWLTSDTFDIVATVAGNPPREQIPLMLRALLAERFKLVVHTETRDLPIYALVLARKDGKLGARIRRATFDCLAGAFDLDLEWTPDQRRPEVPQQSQIVPNGPSLFTALQEQLGLKLEPTRGPVDVLVIDSVSRPTPD